MIVARIIALLIGYGFGLFQTGYLYGKSKGIDIRKQGSGNAGTTNSLRVLGWKAGIITFAGDLLKAVFAVLLVKLIFHGTYGADTKVLELYAGFGTVLGHNFPCYLQFRGGKGIACTTGVILAVCPPAVICCAVGFDHCGDHPVCFGGIDISRIGLSGTGDYFRTAWLVKDQRSQPDRVLHIECMFHRHGNLETPCEYCPSDEWNREQIRNEKGDK